MAITAAVLQQGLTALPDVIAALSGKLADIPADEAVLADAVDIAVMIDPELMPLEIALPVLEWLATWVAANAKPAPPVERSEARGSNPWLSEPPPLDP